MKKKFNLEKATYEKLCFFAADNDIPAPKKYPNKKELIKHIKKWLKFPCGIK